ncbi:uncharacterized protein LOC144381847 isoform X2 [Halichoerus grypus]
MATRQAYQITGWRDSSNTAGRSGLGGRAEWSLRSGCRLYENWPYPSSQIPSQGAMKTRIRPMQFAGTYHGGNRECLRGTQLSLNKQ